MKQLFRTLFICFTIFTTSSSFAQSRLSSANIGLEIGNWKPSTLDDKQGNPLGQVDGADLYFGFIGSTPAFGGYALRFGVFQWQQHGLEERTNKESITLRHFSTGIKNSMLPLSPITPYVSFGVSAIWSREVPIKHNGDKIALDRAGIGIDVGAGLNLLVHQKWAIALEYQYLYAKFSKPVGLTDNYSGPKISFKLLYIF
jgi:opacity protein-like surface antigen